ncbi:site-2 protease family protein [Candidatus Woesearchaeota archaeon]|nr:site-2 protease family protein [Candidatus Woesearchaeota archaeon]
MSFLAEYKWVLLFYLALILLVYFNRKRFEIQAKIIALYKTQIGVKFIEKFVRNKEKLIQIIGIIGIFLGYIGIMAVFYFVIQLLITMFQAPTVVRVGPVLPGAPIIGMGIKFPLIIGWISLLLIIIIHEGSHGIVAKAFKQKIKSTGIAFFGPIPGAFVEIDENKLQKQKDHVQCSVFAAGPNANIITSVLFFLILSFLLAPAADAMLTKGVKLTVMPGLPAELSGIRDGDIITRIDDTPITMPDDFKNLGVILPNTTHTFHTIDGRIIPVTARENPENTSAGQFGINIYKADMKNPGPANKIIFQLLTWLIELFFWLAFIGFNIGLINFLPIFITDGARILQVLFNRLIKNKAVAKQLWLFINKLTVLIFILLIFVPIITNAVNYLKTLI